MRDVDTSRIRTRPIIGSSPSRPDDRARERYHFAGSLPTQGRGVFFSLLIQSLVPPPPPPCSGLFLHAATIPSRMNMRSSEEKEKAKESPLPPLL